MISPLDFLYVLCKDSRLSVHIRKFSFGEIKFMCIFWRFDHVHVERTLQINTKCMFIQVYIQNKYS